MPNMSYCRWENTSNDMQDCVNSIEDLANDPKRFNELSHSEQSGLMSCLTLAFEMLSQMPLHILREAEINLDNLPLQEDINSAENPLDYDDGEEEEEDESEDA